MNHPQKAVRQLVVTSGDGAVDFYMNADVTATGNQK